MCSDRGGDRNTLEVMTSTSLLGILSSVSSLLDLASFFSFFLKSPYMKSASYDLRNMTVAISAFRITSTTYSQSLICTSVLLSC